MKRSELIFTIIRVPLDFLTLLAAASAAFYLRFHPFFTEWRPVIFDLSYARYMEGVWPIILLWIAIFAFARLYAIRPDRIAGEVSRIVLACSTGLVAVFALLFFSRTIFESRFIAVAAWVLAILFICTERILLRLLQRSLLRYGIGVQRVALVGSNKSTERLMQLFQTHPILGFRVVGKSGTFTDETEKKWRQSARNGTLDEILLADPNASREQAARLLTFTDSEHLEFRYSADLFAVAAGKSRFHTYAGIPVIEVRKTPLEGWGAIYKRCFDIVGSLLLIIITLPIQLVVAIALFVEQPGRILFSRLPDGTRTTRVGQGGRPFHYFKFRSMIKDAHKYRFDKEFVEQHGNMREGTPLFKLKDDPRVTPVGRFIRKFSFDEIAEFYLVFMGRMSLVGPRPHLPEEVAKYTPSQRRVLTVKPGITGMPQTSGRADLDFDEEVRLDIHYIEHWSPYLDLILLLKTPLAVLSKKGAY